ncbi:MAG: rubrerythrin family protein [Clostridia bacterium]|nr:rubrerythrin family protein [Clostridia bacterium]
MDFKESRTKENLMRAFAGESQARNRYIFSAHEAKKSNLYVIESVFEFTAKQEEAHAKVYYDCLKEIGGKNITIDGNYPVDIYNNVLDLLKAAAHNEMQEYEHDYREFGDIAKEEGFTKISNIFYNIADIEKTHSNRFAEFANMLENDKLFISDVETEWMCLNCGFIYKGAKAPEMCPVCKHNKGYFIRIELAPYAK